MEMSRKYQEKTLDNGIKVISEYFPSQVASINVSIRTGSMFETYETSGVAHFLEHLMFKGTANRNKLDIEKGIENLG
jgi:predicted Zn-dependent peptidase